MNRKSNWLKVTGIFLIILILFLCQKLWWDKSGQYGGYYEEYNERNPTQTWIALDKGEYITAADNENEKIKKGTWIKYINSDLFIDSVIFGKEGVIIASYVDDVTFDRTFILVDQKSLDSIFGTYKIYYYSNNQPYTARDIQVDKHKLKQSKFHQYWIIIKNKDYVYGPFRKKQYFKMKKILGVPKDLKLDFE